MIHARSVPSRLNDPLLAMALAAGPDRTTLLLAAL